MTEFDAITQGDVCLPGKGLNFWPNLDFDIINKIEEKHPDCLFVLNYRDPKKTVSSMKRWNNMSERFKRSDIPGLPKGVGDDRELEGWIVGHMQKVRGHFIGKDDFLEIDIEDSQAPSKLSEKMGVKLAWWGVENKNEKKSKHDDVSQEKICNKLVELEAYLQKQQKEIEQIKETVSSLSDGFR